MLKLNLYHLPNSNKNKDAEFAATFRVNYQFYFDMGVEDGKTNNLRLSIITVDHERTAYIAGYKSSGGLVGKALKAWRKSQGI